METGDSLREDISHNLNENLTEHEVVRWTVVRRTVDSLARPDTVKVERVTERTRSRDNIATYKTKKEAVRTVTVRDTVYVAVRDTVESFRVQGSSFKSGGDLSGNTALHGTLKWVFWIIIGLIGLIVTVKVCHQR